MGGKYEANQEMLDRLNKSIKIAREREGLLSGVRYTPLVRLIEGDHYYDMSIIYASLLAEHIKEQLALGNVVDVQLFSLTEWLEMEEKLQEELNNN